MSAIFPTECPCSKTTKFINNIRIKPVIPSTRQTNPARAVSLPFRVPPHLRPPRTTVRTVALSVLPNLASTDRAGDRTNLRGRVGDMYLKWRTFLLATISWKPYQIANSVQLESITYDGTNL